MGVPALLLEGRRTDHSRFKIPVPAMRDSTSRSAALAFIAGTGILKREWAVHPPLQTIKFCQPDPAASHSKSSRPEPPNPA